MSVRRQFPIDVQQPKQARQAHNAKVGSVRVIGGSLRGSKLPVLNAASLRPTSDRVRETLFNWLGTRIIGATCVDLFAGSGALAFEALSRGAGRVLACDSDPAVADNLVLQTHRLKMEGRLVVARADLFGPMMGEILPAWAPIDVAFIDPPYAAGLAARALTLIEPRLGDGALVYLEEGVQQDLVTPPSTMEILRAGKTRHAQYRLLRFNRAAEA